MIYECKIYDSEGNLIRVIPQQTDEEIIQNGVDPLQNMRDVWEAEKNAGFKNGTYPKSTSNPYHPFNGLVGI